MGKDMSEVVGTALGRAARDAVQNVSATMDRRSRGPLSGGRGLLAGAGLAVLAPVATKRIGRIIREVDVAAGARPLKIRITALPRGQ